MFLKRYVAYHRIAKPLSFITLLGLFLLFNFYFLKSQNNSHHQNEITIHFDDEVNLKTQVSDTTAKRTVGLSNHSLLKKDEAMLFIFERSGYYGFHMPDMNFPIDIFWLDENRKIIYVKESAQPEDYPEVYTPPQPALYVIETIDGFADEYNAQIGDAFIW